MPKEARVALLLAAAACLTAVLVDWTVAELTREDEQVRVEVLEVETAEAGPGVVTAGP